MITFFKWRECRFGVKLCHDFVTILVLQQCGFVITKPHNSTIFWPDLYIMQILHKLGQDKFTRWSSTKQRCQVCMILLQFQAGAHYSVPCSIHVHNLYIIKSQGFIIALIKSATAFKLWRNEGPSTHFTGILQQKHMWPDALFSLLNRTFL